MHSRSLEWAPLAPGVAAVDAAISDDGWWRLELRSAGPPPPNWPLTIDPMRDRSRRWRPEAIRDAAPRAIEGVIRPGFSAGGVEGAAHPGHDSRGEIPISGSATPLFPNEADPRAGTEPLTVAASSTGFRLEIPIEPDAPIFGLGEKTGRLDKRGRTWVMWNTDEPQHSPDRDPIYQSIPIAFVWTANRTRTLFLDTVSTAFIDAGDTRPDRLILEVYGRGADCYIREDGSLDAAVRAAAELTGTMPLPPLWSLGFLQSRYSYFPEARVRELAARFRREGIPCDGLFLDIHYMDGYRVFTWDRTRFPDPPRLIADLAADGFRVVPIVDPAVKADEEYSVYREGVDRDLFLHDQAGAVYHGEVWPGRAAFPDFLREETVEWWADLHRELLETGVAGIWNDMNEPADFSGDPLVRRDFTVPDSLVSGRGTAALPFGEVHNAYAEGMNRAARIAFNRYASDRRPFVLTRAGCAGVQRNAAVWTGDNHSTWEHLGVMVPMLLNLGLSGVALAGADVAGFQHNATPELYERWIAAASMMPFFRAHTALHTRDHEPWSFGAATLAVARRFVTLRYRLMPYLYTLVETAARDGTPMMRPLLWHFPHCSELACIDDQFMLGEALLVAPVAVPGVRTRAVELPPGRWYDAWDGSLVADQVDPVADAQAGYRDDAGRGGPSGDAPQVGTTVLADAPRDRLPLFLRGGTILPLEQERPHTGVAGDRVLRLIVAPDAAGNAAGTVYEDAGDGFAHERGAWRRLHLNFASGDGRGRLQVAVESGGAAGSFRFDEIAAIVLGGAGDFGARDGNVAEGYAPFDRVMDVAARPLPRDGATFELG